MFREIEVNMGNNIRCFFKRIKEKRKKKRRVSIVVLIVFLFGKLR